GRATLALRWSARVRQQDTCHHALSSCRHPAHSSADELPPRLYLRQPQVRRSERGTHLQKSFLYVLPGAAGATLGGASWVPESTCAAGSQHQARTDLFRLTPSTAQHSVPQLIIFHSPVVPAGHGNLRAQQRLAPGGRAALPLTRITFTNYLSGIYQPRAIH